MRLTRAPRPTSSHGVLNDFLREPRPSDLQPLPSDRGNHAGVRAYDSDATPLSPSSSTAMKSLAQIVGREGRPDADKAQNFQTPAVDFAYLVSSEQTYSAGHKQSGSHVLEGTATQSHHDQDRGNTTAIGLHAVPSSQRHRTCTQCTRNAEAEKRPSKRQRACVACLDWCISSRATPNTPQHCAAAKAQGRP